MEINLERYSDFCKGVIVRKGAVIKTPEGQRVVKEVYPHFILTKDKNGCRECFNIGDLVTCNITVANINPSIRYEKVKCIEDDKVFDSYFEAAEFYEIKPANIYQNLKRIHKFTTVGDRKVQFEWV